MIIIFGQKSKKIAEEVKMVNNAGTMEQAVINIFQNYFHVFWIPMFPLNRNYLIYFPETGELYEKTLFKKMPEKYREICRQVSRNAKAPLWMFSGIGIIILLIIVIYVFSPK